MIRLALVFAVLGCGTEPRVIITDDSNAALLDVEVDLAETAAERRTGLRGRDLAAGRGLLIVLPRAEDPICIVNDGVGFAIDAVFIGDDERVSAVEGAIPADTPDALCHPARYVLEVNAGVASAVGVGNRVTLPE